MFVFYSVFLTEIQHKIPQRVRFVKDAIVVLARKIPGTKKRRHWEKLQTSFCEKKKKKERKNGRNLGYENFPCKSARFARPSQKFRVAFSWPNFERFFWKN